MVKQKSTKQKKRLMYTITLSQNTTETPLLGFTKIIPDPTLTLALPWWGASSAAS